MEEKQKNKNISEQKLENVTGGQMAPNPYLHDSVGADIMRREKEQKKIEEEKRKCRIRP